MPHKTQSIHNESIIYINLTYPFKPTEEFPEIHKEVDSLAQKMERPIFRIVDLTESRVDFATIVEFLQQDTSPVQGSATDWRFKPIFVGNDNIAKMAAESLSQQQYGGIESRLFTSSDDAIAYSKRELRELRQKRRTNS